MVDNDPGIKNHDMEFSIQVYSSFSFRELRYIMMKQCKAKNGWFVLKESL